MTKTKDLLASYKRPEKNIQIAWSGDLQVRFDELERELKDARENKEPGTLGGGESARSLELAQQIMKLREKMREESHTFRFRGIPRRAYSDLIKDCPPSEEDKEKGNDVDWELFSVRIVAASAIEPTLTDEDAGMLADEFTQSAWNAMVQAALFVNQRDSDVPFSYSASAVLQTSRKNSK